LGNFGFEVFLKRLKSKRRWNEDDIAKLKAMGGKEPGDRIAAELGRTLGAIAVRASKRGLSLRINITTAVPSQTRMVHQRKAFFNFPGIE
jgi:hypothetical protein